MRALITVLSFALLAATAGCASIQPEPPTVGPGSPLDVQALRERAQAYWAARVAKDLRAQYAMLEPRAKVYIDADGYGRDRIVEYLAAQVEDIEVAGNFGRVSVRLLVRVVHPLLPRPETRSSLGRDHWVRIRGVWYRSLEAERGVPEPWPAPGVAGG